MMNGARNQGAVNDDDFRVEGGELTVFLCIMYINNADNKIYSFASICQTSLSLTPTGDSFALFVFELQTIFN